MFLYLNILCYPLNKWTVEKSLYLFQIIPKFSNLKQQIYIISYNFWKSKIKKRLSSNSKLFLVKFAS